MSQKKQDYHGSPKANQSSGNENNISGTTIS